MLIQDGKTHKPKWCPVHEKSVADKEPLREGDKILCFCCDCHLDEECSKPVVPGEDCKKFGHQWHSPYANIRTGSGGIFAHEMVNGELKQIAIVPEWITVICLECHKVKKITY